LWGLAVYPEFEQYATSLADFRKEHPSLMKPDMFDKVLNDKKEFSASHKNMAQEVRENISKINAMTA